MSLTVVVPVRRVRFDQRHASAAMHRKPNAAFQSLNVVDATLRVWNALMIGLLGAR